MPPELSKEMRRLKARWDTKTGWPRRLDWIEIEGIRGWIGQRFELQALADGLIVAGVPELTTWSPNPLRR